MATQTLYPDGTVFTVTGFSGTVTNVDEAPDGTWLTSTGSGGTLRASFPTPSGDLNTGVGLQTLRLYCRRNAGSSGTGIPTITIGVRETGDGADLATGTDTNITSDTGQWITFTWNASVLNDGIDGNAVEVYCTMSKGGGGPNERNVEVDSVEWIADYQAAIPVTVTPSGVGATGSVGSVTTGISKTLVVSGLSATGSPGTATVTAKANAAVTGLTGTTTIDSVTVAAKATVTISGVATTGLPGTATTGISKTQVITGLGTAAFIEPVTIQAVQAPTVVVSGLGATGVAESVTLALEATVSVSGISATGQIGTATTAADCNVAVSGLSVTGAVEPVTVDTGAVTWEQEGFRFRNDNNTEALATWVAAQDANVSLVAETNYRLRILTVAVNDPAGTTATLQYRKVGDADWHTIE